MCASSGRRARRHGALGKGQQGQHGRQSGGKAESRRTLSFHRLFVKRIFGTCVYSLSHRRFVCWIRLLKEHPLSSSRRFNAKDRVLPVQPLLSGDLCGITKLFAHCCGTYYSPLTCPFAMSVVVWHKGHENSSTAAKQQQQRHEPLLLYSMPPSPRLPRNHVCHERMNQCFAWQAGRSVDLFVVGKGRRRGFPFSLSTTTEKIARFVHRSTVDRVQRSVRRPIREDSKLRETSIHSTMARFPLLRP